MTTMTLTSKRQATFPKEACKSLGLKPGDVIQLEPRIEDGEKIWVLRPQHGRARHWLGCLGAWQFQPVAVPADFKRGAGEPPQLPLPKSDGWDIKPIKIPSPWNVNTWGGGRNVGAGTERPFWPDSVYFPSYPAAWDHAEMGWLRRAFRVPADWGDRRIVLHFEAVAGHCQVLVNGQPAGTHFDKYLPFEMDITRLVRRDGDNKLLVGVRAHALFDKQSQRYPKMRAPYPCGSMTDRLVGIWQDVFLLGLPPVRVKDVFVKPLVDKDTLELEVTVRNDSEREQPVAVGGEVSPWHSSPHAPREDHQTQRFTLSARNVVLIPGATAKLTLRERANGRLKLWAPGSPNLYAAVLLVKLGDRVVDSHFTWFGWRQFAIRGSELLLNGKPIKLTGDFLHPFGPFVWSRIYVEGESLHMDIGRGGVVKLPDAETRRRLEATTPQWPIMHAVTYGVSRDQLMAKHQANHIQVAYAKDAKAADECLFAKAAFARALGIRVNVCGDRDRKHGWNLNAA